MLLLPITAVYRALSEKDLPYDLFEAVESILYGFNRNQSISCIQGNDRG